MVLQYKPKKGKNWKDYSGKDKLKGKVDDYHFRLLSKDGKKLIVKQGSYTQVMKRFRQIEFFKHQ